MRRFAYFLCLCLLLCGCGNTGTAVSSAEIMVPTTAAEAEETKHTEQTALPEQTEAVDQVLDADTLVPVLDYLPELLVELRYATENNFTGSVIYDSWEIFLRYGTVQKLMAAETEFHEMGLRLKLWDAFRPVSAQEKLWGHFPDARFVSHPLTGNRNHCRGNAVDVTLCDANGKELEMPSEFDDFSSQADRDFSDSTETAAKNAELLCKVMADHGFLAYNGEWWHFSDEINYPVAETFEPVQRILQYAVCQEYITLRTEPSTAAEEIIRIPAEEALEVLAYDGDFAFVSYEGLLGYVLRDYIRSAPQKMEQEVIDEIHLNRPWYYANCEEFISLRERSDVTAAVITQIPSGEKFQLLETHGDFGLVDYRGIIGYVALAYIEPLQ